MKVIVQCTGSFMLLDPTTGEELDYVRPCVVTRTEFVSSRMALNQVRLVSASIGDDATDAEFGKFWKDSNGDESLAVSSFVSAFPKEKDASAEEDHEEDKNAADKKAAAKAAGKKDAKGSK